MRVLKTLLFLFASTLISAQSFDFLAGIRLGDGEGEDDESTEIAFFSNGDLLVAGQFEGLIDFDPQLSQRNLQISIPSGGESYFARYSPQGQLIWWRALRSKRDVHIYGIKIDQNDNVYLTGTYIQELILDEDNPNAQLSGVSPNDGDGYLTKFDAQGNYQWATRFAGSGIDAGFDLDFNPAGELVLLGVFGDSLQFDPNQSSSLKVSAGAGDVFFAGFDTAAGQFLWTEQISGLGFDNPRAIAIDSQGNYYLNGDFTAITTFSLNPLTVLNPSGGNDIFVAKYNANRQIVWAQKIAGSSTDLGADMTLINDTLLAISGTFRGNVQLDPVGNGPLRTGNGWNADIFLVVWDTAAQYQWGHTLGGSATDATAGLVVDQNQRVWIGGYLVNAVDLNPDPNFSFNVPGTGGDGFIAAYQVSDGQFFTAHHLDGSAFSRVHNLAHANNGRIWSVGALYGTANFDVYGGNFSLSSPANNNPNSFFAAYQNSSFDTAWVTEDRLGGDDYLTHAEFLNDGNIIATGYFQGGIDADPDTSEFFLDSRGGQDVYLIKYDSNFDLIWALQMGGINGDQATALAEDASGNLYLAGHYSGTFFYPTSNGLDSLVSQSQLSVFLAKINSQGQLLWMKDIQGLGNEYAYGLSVNNQGQVALAGMLQGNISFDGLNTSPNVANRGAFLAVYDSSGSYLWSQIIDGPSNEFGYTCLAADNGDFFLGGSYRNTVDFDPGPAGDSYTSQFGGNDVFLAKYNSSGQYQWVKVYGQNSFEGAFALDEDAAGNLYLAGEFSSLQDFNPPNNDTLRSKGATDIFILSLDTQGGFRWVKQLGGSSGDLCRKLKVVDDQVYHTGYFYVEADLNPGPDTLLATSEGQHAIYLQVLDTAGQFINALSFGSTGEDVGFAVDHLNGKTLLGGIFERAVDFDPNPAKESIFRSAGDLDGFLTKLGNAGPCPTRYDTVQVQACGNYWWEGQVYTSSGIYQKNLFTSQGCDSIRVLDLQLNPIYDSLSVVNACDSFSWRGQVYHQNGIYVDSLQTFAGCDSIFRLDLQLHPTFRDTLRQVFCDSFLWRGRILSSSGWYYDSLSSSRTCDSIYVLDLDIRSSFKDTLSITACASYQWRGNSYSVSGLYSSIGQSSAGCDSSYFLDLQILPSYTDSLSLNACDSFSWRGNTYYQSGIYYDSLTTQAGCDSVFILQAQIEPTFYDSLSIMTCDSFFWRGNSFTNSGVYHDSLLGSNGCDSIYVLDLTLSNSQTTSLNIIACDSAIIGGKIYRQSGFYRDTLNTILGCDSILEINLSVDTLNLLVATNGFTASSLETGAQYQWLRCPTYTPISGASQAFFDPAQYNEPLGDFAVEISKGACVDTSSCISLTPASSAEDAFPSLKVYPNPNRGNLHLVGSILGAVRIIIYSANGQIIYNEWHQELPELLRWDAAPGLYQVEISNAEGRSYRKIIKL